MKNFLLPYHYKFVGGFLASVGIVLAVFYLFFDFCITIPVFAICSIFIETKFFTTFQTNFADELILLLVISGLGLLVFSKEKNESKNLDDLRFKSLRKSIILNTTLVLISILFSYGGAFLAVMVCNLFSVFIFYLIFFHLSKRKRD